jgi:hypothetical protein
LLGRAAQMGSVLGAEVVAVEVSQGTVHLGKLTGDLQRGRPAFAGTAEFRRYQQVEKAALLQQGQLLERFAAGTVALGGVAREDLAQPHGLGKMGI